MKRMPLLLSLLAVIALSASLAYWFLQLYKPQQRPIAAMPTTAALPEPMPDAAATLFGGQMVTAVASNYQLTGVVASGREGVAILVADGQPPKAVRVGREISTGVLVAEVHPRYVMLSEGGILKRIELATDTTAGPDLVPPGGMQAGMPPMMPSAPMPPPPAMAPQPMPAPMAQPSGGQSPEPELQQEQQQEQQQQQGPVEAPPPEGMPQQPQALPPGVNPSPPGVRMPMPNRNFMPNPPSSQ